MALPYRDIQLSITDRVGRITFNRPPLNVLTISMMKETADAVQRIGARNDTCAIVFAASPTTRAFSAGVSIEEHKPETVYQMLDAFHSIFRAVNVVSKPMIALVSGAALGGGCELVAFADIAIATHSARFGQPEIKVGVFPPVAAVMLPQAVGQKKAREMILTGELVTADEALSLGLINHVVGELELEAKAEEVLAVLRQMSVPALEMSKKAIAGSTGLSFDAALKQAEDVYLNQLMSYKDPQEGVDAFLKKRPPRWKHK